MKFKKAVLQDPFDPTSPGTAGTKTVVSGSNDYYGAHSLETFSSASGLTYTHEDADGFLDYPTSFAGKAANYWKKDGNVKVWAYEETYDNWQDTYGMDAVMAFYHSGHGAMDGSGVFQAPLGGTWDGRDWVFSNRMAFANETLRYLFWSTCFSLRVSGPDSPVRTWWDPNKGGLRMLFGYETTSVDNPNYGKYFWDEWKKGKSFGRAFLDASWRISHAQVPVAMAVGSNQTDAINRLNNERLFYSSPVTKGWYQWQWIGTLPTRSYPGKSSTIKKSNAILLGNKFADDAFLGKLAREVGIPKSKAETILFDMAGNRMVVAKDVQMTVNDQGALNIFFGKANLKNTSVLNEKKAIQLAQSFIAGLDLNKGIDLSVGNIRHRFLCGGSMEGSGRVETPAVTETIVQFRQNHKGIPSVNSDHGLIAIGIDNDGRIVNYYDSTRAILGEVDKPAAGAASSPRDPKKAAMEDMEKLFKKKISRLVAEGKGKSSSIRAAAGYDFSSNIGTVVQQQDVEIDFGKKLKKRYKVRVPIV